MTHDLQNIIGYRFRDENLLREALTHSSFANEKKTGQMVSNERLEFLGDAVLEIVISEVLFKSEPVMSEGEMTRIRAGIVCEQSISKAARKIGLGDFLYLGRGEDLGGGRNKDSILADAFEAVIGSVFLDGGIDEAGRLCTGLLAEQIGDIKNMLNINDCKTYLQELMQKMSSDTITYEICKESGPDHNKMFGANAVHKNIILGYGEGKTKKEAEQNAAYDSIRKIKN